MPASPSSRASHPFMCVSEVPSPLPHRPSTCVAQLNVPFFLPGRPSLFSHDAQSTATDSTPCMVSLGLTEIPCLIGWGWGGVARVSRISKSSFSHIQTPCEPYFSFYVSKIIFLSVTNIRSTYPDPLYIPNSSPPSTSCLNACINSFKGECGSTEVSA